MKSSTVSVELCEGCKVIRITGDYGVDVDDVVNAFTVVTGYLDSAAQPLDIVIDLRNSPQLPFLLNTHRVLCATAAHPQRGRWLLIGSYAMTCIVRRIIHQCGQNENTILSFSDEAQLLTHFAQTEPARSRACMQELEPHA